MGFCRDCRYWLRPSPMTDEVEQDTIGVGWGDCQKSKGIDGGPRNPETKAFARDAENYGASLRTRSDFGCVQFQGGGAG